MLSAASAVSDCGTTSPRLVRFSDQVVSSTTSGGGGGADERTSCDRFSAVGDGRTSTTSSSSSTSSTATVSSSSASVDDGGDLSSQLLPPPHPQGMWSEKEVDNGGPLTSILPPVSPTSLVTTTINPPTNSSCTFRRQASSSTTCSDASFVDHGSFDELPLYRSVPEVSDDRPPGDSSSDASTFSEIVRSAGGEGGGEANGGSHQYMEAVKSAESSNIGKSIKDVLRGGCSAAFKDLEAELQGEESA